MSEWAQAFDALRDIDSRREQAVEADQAPRRLERARRLAERGHLNPIQLPLMAAVGAVKHRYDPTPVVNGGIAAVKAGCSCGWKARRLYYTDQVAKRWWRRHVSTKTRERP